jgi:hypothetical protein
VNELSSEEVGRWILAIAKHLKAFVQDSRLAYLYAIRRSAKDGELLLRLRGLGRVSPKKVEALALDVGIPAQELDGALERLESTGLISAARTNAGKLANVTERIFTEQEVFRSTASLFEAASPQPSERAMIPLLDLMSKLPLTEDEAIAPVCALGHEEEDVRQALELQEAFGLLRRQHVSDLGLTLLHNEYLWGHKIERIGSILGKLAWPEKEALLALMEEVRASQGRPLDKLTAAPPHIVALAANTGILDTTSIVTANNRQKTFAFSPHFHGYRAGPQVASIDDYSDQVKLFVASITYGVNYSEDFRLHSPIAFVEKLVSQGEAGNARPILRDYILLEKQGILGVEERTAGRGTFVVQMSISREKLTGFAREKLTTLSGQRR